MPNPNKLRGDRAERAVRDYLRANGFPHCERTRAGYTRDAGDLHPAPGATAGQAVPVAQRRGLGDPGQWLAVMPLAAIARLLRDAGYGHDLETLGEAL
ncbi:hypothetical protein [Prescottella equi]|uniref:hypothetical protein n=1 Tax=Rhodococcus hoagii TaxID=43767 RepID=UPI0007CD8EEE|nr:hypothetical protein [Prescottella equi]